MIPLAANAKNFINSKWLNVVNQFCTYYIFCTKLLYKLYKLYSRAFSTFFNSRA